MTHHAPTAQVAPPPPPTVRVVHDATSSFTGIAALGAAFAGIVTYDRNPDLLATVLAAGLTFLGALVALHVLHFVFRLVVTAGKVAIPIAALLLIGCALDWPWAEHVVDWLRHAAGEGLAAAQQGWAAWQAR